ncbi:MAG: hypothetical protein QMD85_02430 [Candidatus Aenigmarchaeota archaeon]|nr:hypothetical protein [Candidatus Aenigmarchaeota archaeon]MDI6722396.1 hypothetical protein [Candidatus Aenigmarchaeota archaeon]
MPKMPENSLTIGKIKKLAGATIFERGCNYYQYGHVREVLQFGYHISARVSGSRIYSVTGSHNSHPTSYHCSCPYDGFCKHIVAVLMCIANNHAITHIDSEKTKKYLLTKSPDELADMIINHGISHLKFLKSIASEAQASFSKIDTSFFKTEIDGLLDLANEIDYHEVRSYVKELEELANRIKAAIKNQTVAAAEILFYFLQRAITTLDTASIDDSDGDFGDFIIAMGKSCSEAIRASGYVPVAKEIANSYFKAADYGVEDCFDFILKSLPDSSLKNLEIYARKKFKSVKEKKNSWESISERYFLAAILARLGKRREYTEICGGDRSLLKEIKAFEKEK